jgi:hypothetical protein
MPEGLIRQAEEKKKKFKVSKRCYSFICASVYVSIRQIWFKVMNRIKN